MEISNLGPSFAGLFLGAAALADDIRTNTSSLQCLEEQVHLVQSFMHQNGLSLNIEKCEIMIAAPVCNVAKPIISIDTKSNLTKKSVKCIGFRFLGTFLPQLQPMKQSRRLEGHSLCIRRTCFRAFSTLFYEELYMKYVLFLFCCIAVRIGY